MFNCPDSGRRPQCKDMEGQYKLVGPQRPSTHDQLFASLLITRNLIFSHRRIEVSSRGGRLSILFRPSNPTRCQKSEAPPLEWPDRSAGVRVARNIALSPLHNWNDWLRWPGTRLRLPRNTQRRSISRRICAHLDRKGAALAHRRIGEFGRKGLDTRGTEVSRVSDE